MTLSTVISELKIPGNGSQTVFNYNFLIPYQQDGVTPAVNVWYEDTTGAITQLGTLQYSITGVGNPAGGTVIYNPGSPIAVGTYLTIERNESPTQDEVFANQSFYPSAVEQGLDWITGFCQQLFSKMARSIRAPAGETMTDLPSATARANMVLGFDAMGNPAVVAGGGGGVGTVAWGSITGKPSTFTPTPSAHTVINDWAAAVDAEIDAYTEAGSGITFTNTGGRKIKSASGGGAVSSVQSKTGAVVLKESDISGLVSIKDYGAKCDGNTVTETGTDDTTAWNAAIADINAGTIAGILVPGYSFVNGALTTITNRCAIIGMGAGVSGIIQTSSSNVIMLSFSSNGATTTQQALTQRYFIDGLFIGTMASNQGQAMQMHSHNSNFGNVIQNCIVSGWPTHQTSLVSGNRYGFTALIELINPSSSYFTNNFTMGYHDLSGTFPTNNLETAYAWKVWAESGKGAFNNRWINCDPAACNIGWYMPSGDLQGMFFEACNPGTVGFGWQIVTSGTNLPCFEFVDCQTEVFYDSINITNAAYVMVSNCQHYLDSNLAYSRAAIRLTSCIYAFISNNQVVGAAAGLGTHSFLIASNCDQVQSSNNNMFGLSGYGVYWTGTTSNSYSSWDTCLNPVSTATPYKNDSSNNTTNKRRNWQMTGATQAQGQSPQSGSNTSTLTLATGSGTTLQSAASMAVEVGDRIQVQIATDVVYGATSTYAQILIKETNYVGTAVINFCVDQKNFSRYARLDSTVGRQDFYETIEFDIVAAEPAAILSLIGISGSGDVTSSRAEILVRRL